MKKSVILIILVLALAIAGTYAIRGDGPLNEREKEEAGRQDPAKDTQDGSLSAEDKSRVEEYIKENISELSPEEAVLGGSFRVTSIEFVSSDSLIVDYEDGHIALTAGVGFSVSPDGKVEVASFELMEDEDGKANFSETGNIVGEAGSWELVYEEPGKPALRVRLVFDEDSVCADEGGDCLPAYWQNGDRANVSGIRTGESVKVRTLRIVGEASRSISGDHLPLKISSFEECVDGGYEVMYPDCEGCQPYCETPDGQRFVETEEGNDLCVDNCGNGVCEEMVCMGKSCPCAETVESCPQDCK